MTTGGSSKRSDDPVQLREAASALAELGPQAEPAAWELVRLLSDRQAFGHYRRLNEAQVEEVFRELAGALRAIGGGTAPVVLQAVEHGRPISADVMNALDDSALPELARGLLSPTLKVRRATAERWRDLGARGQVGAPMLIEVLHDKDTLVRKEAAKSLGAVQADPDLAVSPLIEASREPAPLVCLAAVESLGAFTSRAALVLPALTERLADPEPAVREAAVGSLTRFREQKEAAARLLADKLSGADERGLAVINVAGGAQDDVEDVLVVGGRRRGAAGWGRGGGGHAAELGGTAFSRFAMSGGKSRRMICQMRS